MMALPTVRCVQSCFQGNGALLQKYTLYIYRNIHLVNKALLRECGGNVGVLGIHIELFMEFLHATGIDLKMITHAHTLSHTCTPTPTPTPTHTHTHIHTHTHTQASLRTRCVSLSFAGIQGSFVEMEGSFAEM